MEKTISELRKRIEQADEDQGGRKIFAANLREAVVDLSQTWVASGQSRSALARRLGLNRRRWPGGGTGTFLPRVTPRWFARCIWSKMRRRPAAGPLTVRLPSGVCIEGLTLDEVLSVARALS